MGCFEVKTSQKSSKVCLRYVCMFKANFLHKNTNGSSRAYCYFAFSRSNSEGSKKTNLKRTNIMSICCRGWIMLKMTLIKKGGSNKKTSDCFSELSMSMYVSIIDGVVFCKIISTL